MNNIFNKIYLIIPGNFQKIWKRIEHSDIGSRIASGAFWSLFGAVISQLFMLVASIVVARILEVKEFGELGIIRSTVSMFSVFAGFGLGLTATKYIAELKINDKDRTGKIIGITTLFAVFTAFFISIFVLIFAPIIAEKTINAPNLANEIRLSAVLLFFGAINGVQNGILYGFESFKLITKVNLTAGLLSLPIQIVFTYVYGLHGALIGLGLSGFILFVFNYIAIRKEVFNRKIIIQFKKSFDELPIIYKFSLPALFSGLMFTPTIWICNSMLVNQSNGFEEMAIFTAANQWSSAVLFVPVLISRIALPFLSGTVNENQFISILKINIAINFIVALLIAILISSLSSIIMNFYGSEFKKGSIVLIILSLSNILIGINGVIGQAIAGKNKMWVGFFLNVIWSIALLISASIFFKLQYGAIGLAYAFLISYAFHTIMVTIYTTKYIIKKKNVKTRI